MSDRRLSAAERAAVAEEVGAVLRHDLRNNLASIGNANAYLMRKIEGSEVWQSDPRIPVFFTLIRTELERAEALLSRHPTVDQLYRRQLEELQIERVVGSELAHLELAQGIELELDLGQTRPLRLDRAELELVLHCLIENALEAMPAGGHLRVRVTGESAGDVCLVVQDNGVGLQGRRQEEIVRPFVSHSPGRMGLGLSIVRRFAMRYGLRFNLSQEDGWTTVEIRFSGRNLELASGHGGSTDD